MRIRQFGNEVYDVTIKGTIEQDFNRAVDETRLKILREKSPTTRSGIINAFQTILTNWGTMACVKFKDMGFIYPSVSVDTYPYGQRKTDIRIQLQFQLLNDDAEKDPLTGSYGRYDYNREYLTKIIESP